MCRIMQLVLDHFEKGGGFGAFWIVIYACGVEIKNLTVHDFFGRADASDTVQQFLPIIASAKVFHAFIVHCEALYHIFF